MAKGIRGGTFTAPMSPALAKRLREFLVERHLNYDGLAAHVVVYEKTSEEAVGLRQIRGASVGEAPQAARVDPAS